MALLALVVAFSTAAPAAPAASPVTRDDRFGIAHVSYQAGPLSDARYAAAARAGARWNRWALYWSDVEKARGQYDWSGVDAAVNGDTASGFQIDPVLLATPGFYSPGASALVAEPPPRIDDKSAALAVMRGQPVRRAAGAAIAPPTGLYNPVFADGTDTPGVGKAINLDNPWARFVAAAVGRYRDRVHVWEVWNEPDFSAFWSGSVSDYVRLLKVAYLTIRSVDPNAKVLVGGMMYWEWANRTGQAHGWLRAFVDELQRDTGAPGNGYYFDAIPWHFYSRSADVYDKIAAARVLLAARGIAGKRHWLNEANVPACGEPPRNVSCADPNYKGSATVDEQASFVLQALAYGLAVDADHVFQFQFQDDGNGEAFGLFRNDGSARPAYTAYGVAVAQLAGATSAVRQTAGNVEQIVVGTPRGYTTVLWSRGPGAEMAVVSARGASAELVEVDGRSQTVFPTNGQHRIALAGATDNRSFAGRADYIIGGRPRLLVDSSAVPPTPIPTAVVTVTPSSFGAPATPLPGWVRSRLPLTPYWSPID